MKSQQVNILMLEDVESDSQLFGMALENVRANVLLRTVTDDRGGTEYFSGRGVYRDRKEYPLPDIVVLDLRMQNVSGVEFLKWCRSAAECRSIPVVVLTGIVREDPEIQVAMASGANQVYFKPAAFNHLANIAREIYELGVEAKNKSAAPMERASQAA